MSKLQKVFSSFGFLIILIMMFVCLLFGCGNVNDNNLKNDNEPKQEQVIDDKENINIETESEEQEEVKVPELPQVYRFGLGETIPITSNMGDYEVTIVDAYFTDDRNQFADVQPDKVLILVYEYKNISYLEELWFMEGIHYQVYDESGFSLDTYPASTPYFQDSVPVGRSSRGSEAFAVIGDKHNFEIQLGNDVIVEFSLD